MPYRNFPPPLEFDESFTLGYYCLTNNKFYTHKTFELAKLARGNFDGWAGRYYEHMHSLKDYVIYLSVKLHNGQTINKEIEFLASGDGDARQGWQDAVAEFLRRNNLSYPNYASRSAQLFKDGKKLSELHSGTNQQVDYR